LTSSNIADFIKQNRKRSKEKEKEKEKDRDSVAVDISLMPSSDLEFV
jgi:hypothetical protein